MKPERRNAFNRFARGAGAASVAARELHMNPAAADVAASSGVGSAIEYVRRTKAQRAAARKRAKAARRVNRASR